MTLSTHRLFTEISANTVLKILIKFNIFALQSHRPRPGRGDQLPGYELTTRYPNVLCVDDKYLS